MAKSQFNPGAPQLIEFPTHGESAIGYLAVAQMQQDIPFQVKRIFWTYFSLKTLSMAQKNVCSMIKSKVPSRTKKSP